MLKKLSNFSIAVKLYAVIGLCLLALLAVGGVSIFQMNKIGVEITEIAEEDVPLTEALNEITIHQLEQAVNLERALRFGEEMKSSKHAGEQFLVAVGAFEKLAKEVDKELIAAEKLLATSITHAASAEARKEFEGLLKAVKEIEASHTAFDHQATQVLELLAEGKIAAAIKLEDAVEAHEEKLDHQLGAVLKEIETFTSHSAEAAEEHEKFAIVLILILTIAALFSGGGLSWYLVRNNITRPLEKVVAAMGSLAAGDTDIVIDGMDRGDEIGAVARALEELKAAVKKRLKLKGMIDQMPVNIMTFEPEGFTVNYMNEISKETLRSMEHLLPCKADEVVGKSMDMFCENPEHQRQVVSNADNLPHEANVKLGDETLSFKISAVRDAKGSYVEAMANWAVMTDQVAMATRVSEVVEAVASSATEMNSTAESMSSTAEEANTRATAVEAASVRAISSVQTVASAAEELSASISEIGEQVTKSTTIAQQAVDENRKTNDTVKGLSEAAQKIGAVVDLINDIASQTNLLALNATIEAARAGDAGKGFAVVASEVKGLASQTAQATEEIAAQINAMQSVTDEAVSAIGGITSTIETINEIAAAIAEAVEEQGAATQEIARNTQEASKGTQDVSENIAGVTTAAQETGKASKDILSASSDLARQGNELKDEFGAFMEKIGAA